MAKSISNGTDVTRVPDAEAKRMIAQGGWHYVPKNTFRRAARNYEKQMRLAWQRGRKQRQREEAYTAIANDKIPKLPSSVFHNAIVAATQGRYGVGENGRAVKR